MLRPRCLHLYFCHTRDLQQTLQFCTQEIFEPISNISEGAISIDNTLSTDHETFDYYNIPAFQFIQDKLAYRTATHHTNLDFLEYVHKNDVMKNAVILAWTIYSLDNRKEKFPRKKN